MNQDLLQLLDLSNKVHQQIQVLLESEKSKRHALLNHNAMEIDNIVQSQQSAIMKLDNLEKKRHGAQIEAGFSGKTANEILDLVDEDSKVVLKPVFHQLKMASEELQALNKSSLEIANMELKLMDQTANASSEDKHNTYNSSGKAGSFSQKGFSFREKI